MKIRELKFSVKDQLRILGMRIDKTIRNNKEVILEYFRDRAEESLNEIRQKYAESQFKKQATEINRYLIETKDNLFSVINQKAEKEKWAREEKLECLLMVACCNMVVMLESRNTVREYEYMDFFRRIGELWDSFCKLCFEYPINNEVSLFVPPLFSAVKKTLTKEIVDYIDLLKLSLDEKSELKKYYSKVWSLVTSGEIKLELDLHFVKQEQKYVVDFKSGFGSNEKGNLNRLLLVGSVYQILPEKYHCILLVRSDDNNNYFNTLKNSGIWEAYCGAETYCKIKEFSGYDLKVWIQHHIDWYSDFSSKTLRDFQKNNLLSYLTW